MKAWNIWINLFPQCFQIVRGWESNKPWIPKDRITEVLKSYLFELKTLPDSVNSGFSYDLKLVPFDVSDT